MLALGLFAVAPVSAQPPAIAIEYYHVDAVGSVRAVTDASGAVIRRHDYRAFGEGENPPAGADPVRFTGKERDRETGLDYFGARYYASRTGRFTTVDPLMNTDAALTDPQRWNRYAYALNNPLRNVDPDGRDPVPTAWNTGRGADGLLRVLPAIGNALWNVVVVGILQNPGHTGSPEAEARRQAQFMQPANTEEAVIMGLTDVAMLAAPLMRGTESAATIETTAHGAVRIAGQGATRGGTLSAGEITSVRGAFDASYTSNVNGARALLARTGGGRFNVVIEGKGGYMTSYRTISQKDLDRLGRKYEWEGYEPE